MNLFKVARNSFFCAIRTIRQEGVVTSTMDKTGMVLREVYKKAGISRVEVWKRIRKLELGV